MKYTKEHECVLIENGVASIGITAYAVKELGDLVYIELPQKGKVFKKTEVLAVIESVKAAADVFSPVSGEVIEVNQKLASDIELLKQPLEKEGWIAKLRLTDAAEVASLLDQQAYESFVEGIS